MARTPSDTADIIHGVLFGLSFAYTLWWCMFRRKYLKTLLGKLCMANLTLMILRSAVGIRIESSIAAICYLTVFLRVTLPITWMPQLNLVFQTQLFNNIFVKHLVATKRLPKHSKHLLHVLVQLPGFINTGLFLTHMQTYTNTEGYCAVTYDPSRLSQNAIWTFIVALLPFFMSSTMLLHLGPRRHTLPEFTTLFRFSAISNILLTCWAMWTHFESRLYPWREWKLVYFTIVSVWCCVNSTSSYAYLVEQKAKSESRVRELNVNGLGSTPSSLMSTPLASAGIQSGGSSRATTVGRGVSDAGTKLCAVDEREKKSIISSAMRD